MNRARLRIAQRGAGSVVFGPNEATCLYLLPEILRVSAKISASAHQHLPNFSHKILQRWKTASVDVDLSLPLKSPNLKVHHIYRDPAPDGQLEESTGQPQQGYAGRGCRQPLIVPRTGLLASVG